jgi:TetR/AcrR family transcriptional repressor of nem operon
MRLFFSQEEWRSGCPIGNLTQEMGNLDAAFRTRLSAVFNMMQSAIRECLEQARSRKELAPGLDADELAHFILDSWEGALLRMKAEGNVQPLVRFEKIIFGRILDR